MRLHTAALSLAGLLAPAACRLRAGRAAARRAAGRAAIRRAGAFARRRGGVAPVEVDPTLRRLPASRLAMRLEGETDSRELPVYLTAAQAAAARAADRLHERRVGHAGRLSLTASINDVEIGQITIAAAECRQRAPRRAARAAAARLQRHPHPRRQRHRVDCSLAGTYELWTELQPGITGLAFCPRPRASRLRRHRRRQSRRRRRRAHPHPGGGNAQPGHGGADAAHRGAGGAGGGIAHAVVDVDPAPAEGRASKSPSGRRPRSPRSAC